jgi:hypothetical protein
MPRSSAICASEKPVPLGRAQQSAVSSGAPRPRGHLVDQGSWSRNHGVDAGGLVQLLAVAPARIASITSRSRRRAGRDAVQQDASSASGLAPSRTALLALQRAQRLLQRLGEVAADRHRLADRLHVRGQRGVGARELLEGEPRNLDHHVVECRLEAGRGLGGDVVADLVEV